MRILAYIVGALTCAAATTAAVADTTLVYNAEDNPFKVRVRPGAIRIDDTGKRWQLYRQSENTIYSVDPENDSYVRMDADTAATIRNQMQTLRERMEKKLADLPPEQRKTARAALAQQVPGLGEEPDEVSVRSTGNTASVAGRQCRVMEVVRDGESAESLCVAEREALDMSAEEFAAVKSMFGLMKTMLADTGLEYVGLPYLELEGMPIRYANAAGKGRRTLSRVSHDDLADLVFQIPSNYKEQRPQLDE